MSRVNILNDNNFDESIRKITGIIVVLFWTPWCGHCNGLISMIEQVAEEMIDVFFVSVNKDEGLASASKFGIGSVPTFLFIKKGEVVGSELGRMEKAQLKDKINKMML